MKDVQTIGAISEKLTQVTIAGTTKVDVATISKYITGIVVSAYTNSGSASGGTVKVYNGNDEQIATVAVNTGGFANFSLTHPIFAKGGIKVAGIANDAGKVDVYAIKANY